MRGMRGSLLVLLGAMALTSCGDRLPTGGVTDRLLVAASAEEWLSYGRDYDEQRFSPLTQIDDANVAELGLAWSADIDVARPQEATPLVHGGIIYITTAWSTVRAYEARTGTLKWSYDPKVPRQTLVRACCDAVNRGVALYGDKVYVGTLDGRLVALDQKSGTVVFDKVVVPDEQSYTITGAPRVAKGKVFLGSAGAEYKARGYLAAYNAETGEELWKFHTVPGNPADGHESPAMEAAAKTWSGEWWKLGGGGTVWDSITYDPVTNLVLFGTGNAEPWNPAATGRKGNSLYTSSVVALNADNGEYAWHYQETPEDRWDFDSNAQITLADLEISGAKRRVALHAPKPGYFYVLDAKTGEFISAGEYADQNWSAGFDPKTGTPIVRPEARYEQTGKTFVANPGSPGAHNWHPMSFSPKTGLVYIPVMHIPTPYAADKGWQESAMGPQIAMDTSLFSTPYDPGSPNATKAPPMGELVAWDPVKQQRAWAVERPLPGNGGTMATAGNLVFQGTTDGQFQAFSADRGKLLWSYKVGGSIMAAPSTYAIDGEQYIAVLTGPSPFLSPDLLGKVGNSSRLLVFKLGAAGKLPPVPPTVQRLLDPPAFTGTPQQVAQGASVYGRYCFTCHGAAAIGGPINPDLRYSSYLTDPTAFASVVIGGALDEVGMVSHKSALSQQDAEATRQYLIKRANDDKRLARTPGKASK